MDVDTIIIGGGIAGLYYAYCDRKNMTNNSLIILEKNSYIGGRVRTSTFHGHSIVCGAGIGRWNKDTLLKKLLGELGFPVKKTISKKYYYPPVNKPGEFVKHILTNIKTYYKNNPRYRGTLAEVVLKLFNAHVLSKFVEVNGFSDFLNEDFRETIWHYGLDDNISHEMNIFYVKWNALVKVLVEKIGRESIFTNHRVYNIVKQNDHFIVHTSRKQFTARKIVLATDINLIHKLFQNNSLYNYISGQAFSRIYVKFDELSSKNMEKYIKGYTIVPGPLQKIIPISKDDGVYMLAYNDNYDAKFTKSLTNSQLELLVKDLIHEKVKILDSKIIYWKTGTHYFKPYSWESREWDNIMAMMQHPDKNVVIVGEAFSFNQGWVEGALESVENLKR
jgi:hypothetical protein